MPNWVFNSVKITGKEEDLRKFMGKAGKSYTTYYKGVRTEKEDGTWTFDAEAVDEKLHEAPISFMNFHSPEDVDAYFSASDYKPEGYDKMSTEERMAHAMKFSSDGWYDWNIREWGTKWDACNPEITNSDPSSGSLGYRFDTAWSPAEGAYRKMVEQHPELQFEFYCEEEQGWGVEFAGENGEFFMTKEWDIPNSHKDYLDLDWECRACEYFSDSGDPDDLHDDCPEKPELIAKQKEETGTEVEKFEDISEMLV